MSLGPRAACYELETWSVTSVTAVCVVGGMNTCYMGHLLTGEMFVPRISSVPR